MANSRRQRSTEMGSDTWEAQQFRRRLRFARRRSRDNSCPRVPRLPPMTAVFDLRRLPAPIVQAGMGAVARHELAAAVSEAGGLGTIGGVRAPIAEELAAARRLTGRPIAVNLVLPLLRRGDVQAAADADVIVTFWGKPRRLAGGTWVHQCGSVEDARAAAAAGADAVIAQGVE